jgi:hypothetical protein
VTVEVQPNGRVKITYNLATIWVSRDEAESARTDPKAAAKIMKRLECTRG